MKTLEDAAGERAEEINEAGCLAERCGLQMGYSLPAATWLAACIVPGDHRGRPAGWRSQPQAATESVRSCLPGIGPKIHTRRASGATAFSLVKLAGGYGQSYPCWTWLTPCPNKAII